MKKKILISIFVVAIAAVAGWNVSQSKSDSTLSDMSLSNVEALADETSSGKSYVYCSGTDVICVGSGNFNCCR
jgi:hypothetical protein